MYFYDQIPFDYELELGRHIIEKDRQVVEQKLTKVYKPKYEKDFVVKNTSTKTTLKKENKPKKQTKVNKEKKKDLSSLEGKKKNNCECKEEKKEIKPIVNLSTGYLVFDFIKDKAALTDIQKDSIAKNLDYDKAKTVKVTGYSDMTTHENEVFKIATDRAKSVLDVLPIVTKGKTFIDYKNCKEDIDKCGKVEIKLSF